MIAMLDATWTVVVVVVVVDVAIVIGIMIRIAFEVAVGFEAAPDLRRFLEVAAGLLGEEGPEASSSSSSLSSLLRFDHLPSVLPRAACLSRWRTSKS